MGQVSKQTEEKAAEADVFHLQKMLGHSSRPQPQGRGRADRSNVLADLGRAASLEPMVA